MDERLCRYCSAVSKAAGEDPIGTAIHTEQWLFIEVPRPWAKALWADKPQFAPLMAVFKEIEQQPKLCQRLRTGAIAPDAGYSQPGWHHVLFYQRPQGSMAEFQAQAYMLPADQVANLARALVLQPHTLSAFAHYRQTQPTRDMLICTHTHYDIACGRYGTPLYKQLRRQADSALRIWQTSHFGGHRFAPTLIDFPSGRFWGHLDESVLDALLYQQGDLAQLRPFYRGWGGCDRWSQVAEREIWMQEGWVWLNSPKSCRVVAADGGRWWHRGLRWLLRCWPHASAQIWLTKLDQKCTWAKVEIITYSSKGQPIAIYEATVEASHQVITQASSGNAQKPYLAQQYRVVELKKQNCLELIKSQT